ncbi:hypothetical protein FPZ47_10835 [Mycobacterium helveticum]|uniref:NUMOD4 domain-containing protein n=3 Tax=Mycobacterium helveticum TaxID=2592811 RepID=A0A557XVJ2_9MYCO|nr:hypothetical protein FPZ46_12610 [Mycobacterium helveticum]TVS90025.1 hypothetical protein FPZ47_10835 [Mycobacterium helveticum]
MAQRKERPPMNAESSRRRRAMTTALDPVEDLHGEQWRDVVGLEGIYEISNYRRVKTIGRTAIRRDGTPMRVRERIRKASTTKGCPVITLMCDGRAYTRSIDSLYRAAWGQAC